MRPLPLEVQDSHIAVNIEAPGAQSFGFRGLTTAYLAVLTQKLPVLRECTGSFTWNVLERAGTPAVTGPEVMRWVTVGRMRVLMVLDVVLEV